MNSKKFSEAMSEIDSKYIDEAFHYQKKSGKKHSWTKWGTLSRVLMFGIRGRLYSTETYAAL